jgi:serine/threonine protein kinase|eukprot:COSAG01_NODE_2599_length_7398_cov_3.522263_5_plen_94_part_00
MLSGRPPFWSRNQAKLFGMIKRDPLTFPARHWSNVSSEAQDLLTRMLQKTPADRITIEAVLRHPWMRCEAEQGYSHNDLHPSLAELNAYLSQA